MLSRFELNAATGERVEIAQNAYINEAGEVLVLDADLSPPTGFAGMSAEHLEAHRAPTPEQLRTKWKQQRAALVDAIRVTTQAGHTFDGDETAQGRMARAILGLQLAGEGATIVWKLADDSAVSFGVAELQEALMLAGAEQARLWVPQDEPS